MTRTHARSLAATLAALCAATLSIAARCGDGDDVTEPDHAQICVSEQTLRRVDDEWCDDSLTRGTRWFYTPIGAPVPAVGESVDTERGSFTRPPTGKVSTVSRGVARSPGG